MSVAVNGSAPPPLHSPRPPLSVLGTPAPQPTVVPPQPNGAPLSSIQKLAHANESTWLLIGKFLGAATFILISHALLGAVAEQMQDLERAQVAYEHALRHNPHSISGLMQLAGIARIKENYAKVLSASCLITSSVFPPLFSMLLFLFRPSLIHEAVLPCFTSAALQPVNAKLTHLSSQRQSSTFNASSLFTPTMASPGVPLASPCSHVRIHPLTHLHPGHCYLMQDDLQKAYAAYQQALYWLPHPKEDPKLWYGIGILYDRYGSLDHAEEAFASVLRMDRGQSCLGACCLSSADPTAFQTLTRQTRSSSDSALYTNNKENIPSRSRYVSVVYMGERVLIDISSALSAYYVAHLIPSLMSIYGFRWDMCMSNRKMYVLL